MKKVGFGGFAGLVLMGLGFAFLFWSAGKYFTEEPLAGNPEEICKYQVDGMIMTALGEEAASEEITADVLKRMESIKEKFSTPEEKNKCISEITKFEQDRMEQEQEFLNSKNFWNMLSSVMLFLSGVMIFLAFREEKK